MAESADVAQATERDPLRIYGFMDAGYNHYFIPKDSFLYNVTATRAGTFVLGNLNLYLDAQPTDDVRALIEVRFTNYPHGEEKTFGGFGGTYERVDTTAHDFGSPSGNMTNRWGGIIIERAQAEWKAADHFRVMVGQFLSPVGIWYVDHGTPTLISLSLPFFVSNQIVPLRQTGIQLLGDLVLGNVELGYRAYVSNGRTPALLDFTNDKAVGARFTAGFPGDSVNLVLGSSFYWGTVTDIEKNITAVSPSLEVDWKETIDYTETVAGLDASIDVGNLRLRSEGYFRRLTYEPGRHAPMSAPGRTYSNAHEYDAYLLGAYAFPSGWEPFAYTEYWHYPGTVGSDVLIAGAGLTYHINTYTQLKTQVNHSLFFDIASGADKSHNNFTTLYSRFVVAF